MNSDSDNKSNNNVAAEDKQETVQSKTLRRKNIVLKIFICVFAVIFIGLSFVIYKMYKQLAAMKQIYDTVQHLSNLSLQSPQTTLPSGTEQSAQSMLGSINLSFSTSMITSSLMAWPTGQTGVSQEQIDSIQIASAMTKYMNKPVIQQLLNDIKSDPEFKDVMKDMSANDPMKVFASLGKIKNMDKLIQKHAMRPEFMSFAMEILNDPAIQPMLKSLPIGNLVKESQTLMKNQGMQAPAVNAGQYIQINSVINPSVIQSTDSSKGSKFKRVTPPPISE